MSLFRVFDGRKLIQMITRVLTWLLVCCFSRYCQESTGYVSHQEVGPGAFPSFISTDRHRCCRPPGWFLWASEPECDWQLSGPSAGSPTEPRWQRWRWGRSGGGLSGSWPFCICTEARKHHHTICKMKPLYAGLWGLHSGLCTLHLSSIVAVKDQTASTELLTSCSMRLKGKPRAAPCSTNQIGLFTVCLL